MSTVYNELDRVVVSKLVSQHEGPVFDCITSASIPSSSVLNLTENAQSGLNRINYDKNS